MGVHGLCRERGTHLLVQLGFHRHDRLPETAEIAGGSRSEVAYRPNSGY